MKTVKRHSIFSSRTLVLRQNIDSFNRCLLISTKNIKIDKNLCDSFQVDNIHLNSIWCTLNRSKVFKFLWNGQFAKADVSWQWRLMLRNTRKCGRFCWFWKCTGKVVYSNKIMIDPYWYKSCSMINVKNKNYLICSQQKKKGCCTGKQMQFY